MHPRATAGTVAPRENDHGPRTPIVAGERRDQVLPTGRARREHGSIEGPPAVGASDDLDPEQALSAARVAVAREHPAPIGPEHGPVRKDQRVLRVVAPHAIPGGRWHRDAGAQNVAVCRGERLLAGSVLPSPVPYDVHAPGMRSFAVVHGHPRVIQPAIADGPEPGLAVVTGAIEVKHAVLYVPIPVPRLGNEVRATGEAE